MCEHTFVPDTPSLILVKEFTYRGEPEEFSNKYHFSGDQPGTAGEWLTLANGWITEEKKCYDASVRFVRAYGYEASSDHANWVHDYEALGGVQVGTYPINVGPEVRAPGDAAATIRWSTGEYNTRGKLIYCRKYLHGAVVQSADTDQLAAAYKTALEGFAAVVISGFFPGAAEYCGPQGATLRDQRVDGFVTTRTLKRRGKRPLPSAP